MDDQFKVVNNELICNKYNHNERIILVVQDELVQFQDRFQCTKCLSQNSNVTKVLPLNKFVEQITDKILKQQEEKVGESIKFVKEFQQKMSNLQTKVIKLFVEIQQISEQWIQNLQNIDKKVDWERIISEFKSQFQVQNDNKEQYQIIKNNQAYYYKLENMFKRLQDQTDYYNCYNFLKKTIKQENQRIENPIIIQEIQQPNLYRIQEAKDVNHVQQSEWSQAIAFNNNGKIMVSGCYDDLKIWKFENGKLTMYKKLNGHTQNVYCLIFSQKLNWFTSGGEDGRIISWKEIANNEWQKSEPKQQKHQNFVLCLILNQNETELISSSADTSIKIWKINCQNNYIEYDYTLPNKHTDYVYGISMNENETTLISCSKDKQIILWIKDQIWKYQHHIINDDYGYRISFFDHTYFIWQQYTKGIAHIFQIQNGQIQRKPELNIELNKYNQDAWLFPIIVNKQKQVIVQKYNKYVYFLQKKENGSLQISNVQIECKNTQNYGAMTNNGEYLVIWNQQIEQFQIYSIKYQ